MRLWEPTFPQENFGCVSLVRFSGAPHLKSGMRLTKLHVILRRFLPKNLVFRVYELCLCETRILSFHEVKGHTSGVQNDIKVENSLLIVNLDLKFNFLMSSGEETLQERRGKIIDFD